MHRRQMLAASAALAAAMPLAARAQQSAMMVDGTMDLQKAPAILNGTFAKLSSQAALERAENAAVRTFAELEVAEQTAVATAFGVPPVAPPHIAEDKAALLDHLQALSGPEFDRAYVDAQIAGHQELRPIHEAYAANGSDPMARGASMVGVTGIDSHLLILRGIQAQLG